MAWGSRVWPGAHCRRRRYHGIESSFGSHESRKDVDVSNDATMRRPDQLDTADDRMTFRRRPRPSHTNTAADPKMSSDRPHIRLMRPGRDCSSWHLVSTRSKLIPDALGLPPRWPLAVSRRSSAEGHHKLVKTSKGIVSLSSVRARQLIPRASATIRPGSAPAQAPAARPLETAVR